MTRAKYQHILTKEFLQEHFIKLNKSVRQISEEVGIEHTSVKTYVRKFGLVRAPKKTGYPAKDHTGETWGSRRIIGISHRKIGQAFWSWECLDCGRSGIACLRQLKTTSCSCTAYIHEDHSDEIHGTRKILSRKINRINESTKVGRWNWVCLACSKTGCSPIWTLRHNNCHCQTPRGEKSPNYKGYQQISGSYWRTLKNGAKSRLLDFNITIEQVWDRAVAQKFRCAISGRPLTFTQNNIKGNASLDRIDNKKGYTAENIQWIDKRYQSWRMKAKESMNEMIRKSLEVVSNAINTNNLANIEELDGWLNKLGA